MTTLTRTSIVARKIIRYSIYGIIALIVLRFSFNVLAGLYRAVFPTPPPAPTVGFSKLTAIPFPSAPDRGELELTIETPTGTFGEFPTQMKVYFMPLQASSLFSLDESREIAEKLGFEGKEEKINDTNYRFYKETIPSYLEMDIVNNVFSLSYDLAADPSPLSNNPPQTEVASSYSENFLTKGGILPDDLTGPVTFDYLKVENQQFKETISLSQADLVRVNMFRKNFEDYPSMTPKVERANVWFIVSGSGNRQSQVIAGQYHYFPIDEEEVATYPIKTPDIAWQELTSGGGYIPYIPSENSTVVRRVYLAYMDPGAPTEFYQPVYVFEGDEDFYGFVPAVTSEYYGE